MVHVGWHDDHDCSGALGESCFLANAFQNSSHHRNASLRAVWGSPQDGGRPAGRERLTIRGEGAETANTCRRRQVIE